MRRIFKSLQIVLFVLLQFTHGYKVSSRNVLSSRRYFTSTVSDVEINTEKELAKLFGRFADNYLLLDVPGAGSPEMMNCCHGGCDNCNYSHIFDNLTSGRPKWIPLYSNRQLIDGRNHMSPWSTIFTGNDDTVTYKQLHENDNDYTITQATFIERIKAMSYRNTLGCSVTVSANEECNDSFLISLWKLLVQTSSSGTDTTDKELSTDDNIILTPTKMANALKVLTKEEHGATWAHFKNILTSL